MVNDNRKKGGRVGETRACRRRRRSTPPISATDSHGLSCPTKVEPIFSCPQPPAKIRPSIDNTLRSFDGFMMRLRGFHSSLLALRIILKLMSWKRINFQLDAREFYREENYLSSIRGRETWWTWFIRALNLSQLPSFLNFSFDRNTLSSHWYKHRIFTQSFPSKLRQEKCNRVMIIFLQG